MRSRTRSLGLELLTTPKEQACPQYGEIVGKSRVMRRIYDVLHRIESLDFPVLIQGETGTGKELVARAVHAGSRRRHREFVPVNCAALSEDLLESELFGHVRGAFTGAVRDKQGLLELAHNGTAFLDEVSELTPRMQAKLLRFLQDGELRKIGGTHARRVRVRIIAATNMDLTREVDDGRFRKDLFYRLDVVSIRIPPVRERPEDIPLLVEYFLETVTRESGSLRMQVSGEALRELQRYPWPGNVREIENEIKRFAVYGEARVSRDRVSPHILSTRAAWRERSEARTLAQLVAGVETERIEKVLVETAWNKSRAARILGLSRQGLDLKLKRYRIRR